MPMRLVPFLKTLFFYSPLRSYTKNLRAQLISN